MTDTVSLPALVTYTRAPFGWTATRSGACPTGTVATTAFVAVSITDRVWLLLFATYARVPPGLKATPCGNWPDPYGGDDSEGLGVDH